MGSRRQIVDFIVEQAAGAGPVTARAMFGEYGLSLDGRMVALVCDDQLYVKPSEAVRAHLGAQAREGQPYPGAKPHLVVEGERFDDAAWLADLFRLALRDLPPPAPKRRKRSG